MLCEIRLELTETRAGPILEPRVGDVVLDAMKSPLAHLLGMIDTKPDNAYGPFGSTFRTAGPN